jgi:acyl-ACP thioesterase
VVDPRQHAGEHRVRFDECDAGGAMRPSSLLRAVQDLAWQHSTAAGFDRDWYQEHGLTWLVRFVDLRMNLSIESGTTLRMTTRITGLRRVWARRETRVGMGDGSASVAGTTIDWVLVDAAGRPARVPEAIVAGFDQEAPTFTPARIHLAAPPLDPTVHPWRVGVRDLDPMAHVNNATYLDIMDEVMAGATGALVGPNPPVRYEVEYLRSAMPNSVVSVRHWPDGACTTFQLIDEAGTELIRARVEPG